MNRTDLLAIERSSLANERTFLAYLRTFIVLLSSGFAVVNLDFLKEIDFLGYSFIILAPVLMFIGYYRFQKTKKRLLELCEEEVKNKDK